MAEVQAYLSGASAVKGVAAEAHLLGLVKDISPSTKQLYDMAIATATGAASGAGSDGVCARCIVQCLYPVLSVFMCSFCCSGVSGLGCYRL